MSETRGGGAGNGSGAQASAPSPEALAQALCRRYRDGLRPAGDAESTGGDETGAGAREAGSALSDATLQDLVALVVQSYARRLEDGESGEALPPFRSDHAVTATQVVVFVMELLRCADVEVFELGMWQAFGKA